MNDNDKKYQIQKLEKKSNDTIDKMAITWCSGCGKSTLKEDLDVKE